jgi:hypothetical protein
MRWREDDISRVGEIKLLSILKQLLAIRSIYVMEIFQVTRYRGWLNRIPTLFTYQDPVGWEVVEQVTWWRWHDWRLCGPSDTEVLRLKPSPSPFVINHDRG